MADAMQLRIREFLADPNETAQAKAVVKWQWRLYGDFYTALWNAIKMADEDNLGRLHKGFPVEVEGYIAWTRGGLAKDLRAKGVMD